MQIVELALQKLGLEVHSVTNPTTIMEVVSALFDRNCHVKVDKDKLTSLFESWIPPFIQVATEGIYEQQGKLLVWSQRSGSRGTMWLVKAIAPALTLLVCLLPHSCSELKQKA